MAARPIERQAAATQWDSLHAPAEPDWIDGAGRARDPFRPAIEPDGFADAAELARDRDGHLKQVATLLDNTDLFVFTLGLTEAWECVAHDVVLPTCPGTVGGTFDAASYRFKNFSFLETLTDMNRFIEIARARNPAMKFLFTVSPVPLTATASDQHVLVATMQSKSILRAVVAELYDSHDCVDYFPSYELVAAHPMRAMSYMPNLRNVASEGVARVMDVFFGSIGGDEGADEAPGKTQCAAMTPRPAPGAAPKAAAQDDDLVCEEALLEAFGK